MELVYKIALIIFFLVQGVLLIYLLLPFVFLITHALLPTKGTIEKKKKTQNKNFDFAAIVTAHQDARFIDPLVDSFLRQTYDNFILYVIADDCDISNLNFNDPRIKIIKPSIPLHAKIKSIKYAVDQFVREHDVLVVFDSDNLVHPLYLEKLNGYFQKGFRAVQTHMLSKNTETIFAKLDSIGHVYNTFVEREAKMDLGLSSSILGLGIALETKLYKQVSYKDTLGGFDKKLQSDVILNVPQLAFAADAIVYDEKVDDGNTLEKQRTRWIYSYFKYFAVNWNLLKIGFKKFNFNIFFFGFTALRPPLFMMIVTALVFCIIDFFILSLAGWIWIFALLIFTMSFVLIVVTQSRQKGMFKALLHIPALLIRQMSALWKLKKASKDFLKTEHMQIIYIEDILENELR